MLCVPIYNMKLAMMQKTTIFTTFSAHTKMNTEKRGQDEVFGRKYIIHGACGYKRENQRTYGGTSIGISDQGCLTLFSYASAVVRIIHDISDMFSGTFSANMMKQCHTLPGSHLVFPAVNLLPFPHDMGLSWFTLVIKHGNSTSPN